MYITIFTIILTVLCTVVLIIFYPRESCSYQWRCTEGGCEQVLDGEYKSYQECSNRCAESKCKRVTFKETPQKILPDFE